MNHMPMDLANRVICPLASAQTLALSTTLENEAIPTLENEAIQSDWMSDHFGRLGSYSSTRG